VASFRLQFLEKKAMNVEKALVAVAFFFLVCSLYLIAVTGSASGYEVSIYAAYPYLFWVFLITSFGLGISIVLYEAFFTKKSNWWLAGLTIIISANCILFLLPAFRGYYFYDRVDNLQTIAYYKDIETTSHISPSDFYPSFHILIVALSKLTSISVYNLALIFPAFANNLYIIGALLLAKALNFTHREFLLTIALVSAPFFLEQFASIPRILALFLLPFLLFLFLKFQSTKKTSFAILLFLFTLNFVVLHPFNGGLLVMLMFAAIVFSVLIYSKFSAIRKGLANTTLNMRLMASFICVLSLLWFVWYSNFQIFYTLVNYVERITEWSSSLAGQFFGIASSARMSIVDMFSLFLKLDGMNLLYLAIAGVGLVVVFRRPDLRKNKVTLLLLIPNLLFFSLATLISFFSPISLMRLDYTRILPYAILFAVLFNAWVLGSILARKSRASVFSVVLVLCMASLIFGTLNVFPSPWTLRANQQYSQTEMMGASWFSNYQNNETPIKQVFNEYQSLVALSGWVSKPQNVLEPEISYAPNHFGYDRYSFFGQNLTQDSYMLMPGFTYVYYSKAVANYPSAWRWTAQDIAQLHEDPTVNVLYSNGGYEVFYVKTLRDIL
jgi:hypothetical protein